MRKPTDDVLPMRVLAERMIAADLIARRTGSACASAHARQLIDDELPEALWG